MIFANGVCDLIPDLSAERIQHQVGYNVNSKNAIILKRHCLLEYLVDIQIVWLTVREDPSLCILDMSWVPIRRQ